MSGELLQTSEDASSHLIFLSYASPDRARVLQYFDYLHAQGFDVWMDVKRIVGGLDWKSEIQKALRSATIVVIFISGNSVQKRGFVQSELVEALEFRKEKLADDIYLIPVCLEDGIELPSQLDGIQRIEESDRDCEKEIARAIRHQLQKLGDQISETQKEAGITWTRLTQKEAWDGLPGYTAEIQLLRFASVTFPGVSRINEVIKGALVKAVMLQRKAKFEQDTARCNFGQQPFWRTNVFEARCSEPSIANRIISVQYVFYYFLAGAAHPWSEFVTFSFLVDPVVPVELPNLFEDPKSALNFIQDECRKQLLRLEFKSGSEEPHRLMEHWVSEGTEKWHDFRAFVFSHDKLTFLFAAYQVASYNFGPQSATIDYEKLKPLLKPVYQSALGLNYGA